MHPDRRGEAHLWLLLEEALLHVRRAGVEPWESWRNFRAVVDALVVTGALGGEVGDALVSELDDALALRGVVPSGVFTAAPWPSLETLTAARPAPPAGAAVAWLEAEVERHLDLFASFGSDAQAWAASDLVRIVGGPVRAFAAVGMLEAGDAGILEEVVATLEAADVPVPRPAAAGAVPREPWVGFLRSRPGPLPVAHEPRHRRLPRVELGRLDETSARLDAVAWSEQALELDVAVRSRPAAAVRTAGTAAPWHARVLDEDGGLHLGQPVTPRRGAASLRFALRPGLPDGVGRLEVRLTRGGARVEASVAL